MNQTYQSVQFDDEHKKLHISIGTEGDIDYQDIAKVSVLNEDAKFKGSSTPFAHQVLGGVTFMSIAAEPSLYVGLRIELKNRSVKAIYVSDIKTQFNTDLYKKDRKEAEEIKALIDKRIQ